MHPLGRRVPPDWSHVDKYPLRGLAEADRPVAVPVVLGVNWYTNFDRPEQDRDGSWWVGRGPLGTVRGGHCFCTLNAGGKDPVTWWAFYNQGREGACVGFGSSRMKSLLDRLRFDAEWLYDAAKLADGFPDTNPGDDQGTTVSAAMDVLRLQGHRRWKAKSPRERYGIAANRWATTASEVLAALGTPDLDYVTILNSWGQSYPHQVRMPATTLDGLLRDQGEAAVVTDR